MTKNNLKNSPNSTDNSSATLTPQPTVMITGASSGIGFAFAKYYLASIIIPSLTRNLSTLLPTTSQKAATLPCLFLISRDQKKLLQARSKLIRIIYEALDFIKPDKLKNSTISIAINNAIQTLDIDLAEPGAPHEVTKFLEQHHLAVNIFINNAGVGHMGEFRDMSADKIYTLLMLNVVNASLLTHALLEKISDDTPNLQINPYIINVASVAGFIPFPLMAVYGASKSYVVNFSEALARELTSVRSPVKVFTLCPGSTGTEFFSRSGKNLAAVEEGKFMSPEELVSITITEVKKNLFLKKPNSLIVPGRRNIYLYYFTRFFPRKAMVGLAHKLMKNRLKD